MATRMLESKTAVIYGASGGLGGAMARSYAREGAQVFLVARTAPNLEALQREITTRGGKAEIATLDALDSAAVEEHLRKIVASSGRIDVSCNLISVGVGMGKALTELTEAQFTKAAFTHARSTFITATAAARQMAKQKSGVILAVTATPARLPRGNLGGFAVAGAAIESMCRQLALEIGPHGVRVVCLRTGGTPDNPTLQEVFAELARVQGTTPEAVEREEAKRSAFQRMPRMAEVANALVLLATDYAVPITATAVNATCGEVVD